MAARIDQSIGFVLNDNKTVSLSRKLVDEAGKVVDVVFHKDGFYLTRDGGKTRQTDGLELYQGRKEIDTIAAEYVEDVPKFEIQLDTLGSESSLVIGTGGLKPKYQLWLGGKFWLAAEAAENDLPQSTSNPWVATLTFGMAIGVLLTTAYNNRNMLPSLQTLRAWTQQ